MKQSIPTFLAAALVVFGGGTAHALDLSFQWGPTKACFDPKSPPMTVGDVPEGTASLRFRMTDLQAPDYPHGGGSVRYEGTDTLAYGAFRYKGPCPPQPHTYEMRVEALDGNGKVMATAKARKRFP